MRIAAILLLVGAVVNLCAAKDSPLSTEPGSQVNEWAVNYRQKKVMVYAFAPQKYKPYVKELCTIKGLNILRDSAPGHLHHHGLMYAIRVNGLNFWEEASGSGVEKVIETAKPELGTDPQGLPQALLRQTIHWVAPADAFLPDTSRVAILMEHRTLTLTVNEPQQEVALRWHSEFQVGTNEVTLAGSKYFGLGMRFPQALDPVAKHFNADGVPDLSDNKQDVTRHAWGAVSFDQPGQPATVALFGDPANVRGDAWYFTMRTPFAYMSATQHIDQEPLVYRSGEKFQLEYLVTVYPEIKAPEALNKRAKEWTKAVKR